MAKKKILIIGSGLFNDIKNNIIENSKKFIKNESENLLHKGIDLTKNKIQNYVKSKFNGYGLKKRGRPKKNLY